MATTANPIGIALAEFYENIKTAEVKREVDSLRLRLNLEKRQHNAESWRRWCEEASNHVAFEILMQDPYTRDARTKPSGYPGDARTLDYVYLRSYGDQQVSQLGSRLFDVTTSVPIAEAVRDRCRHLASIIAEQIQKAGRDIDVTSIACGHARELDFLHASLDERIRYWGVDQDQSTVVSTSTRIGSDRSRCEVGSVRAILSGASNLPSADLTYASGLFDYLDDRIAGLMLRRMSESLRPGGCAVVANLTPENDEIAFMEAIMSWWMYYRDADALGVLAQSARLNPKHFTLKTYSRRNGRVAWIQVTRLHEP